MTELTNSEKQALCVNAPSNEHDTKCFVNGEWVTCKNCDFNTYRLKLEENNEY